LELVDRREYLPAHAVLDAGGLVDGEEEGRHLELLDDEVRDRLGGAGQRVEEGRVLRGGGPVRVAHLRRLRLIRLALRLPTLSLSLSVTGRGVLLRARVLLLGAAVARRPVRAARGR